MSDSVIIVYFAGSIGVGKTTTAKMVGELLETYTEQKAVKLAFGDGVRQEASSIFNFPIEWTYSQEGKMHELSCMKDYDGKYGEFPKTVREALQCIGEYRRNHNGMNYWVSRLMRQLEAKLNEDYRIILVDDVRHGTEALALRMLSRDVGLLSDNNVVHVYGVHFTGVKDRVAEITSKYYKPEEMNWQPLLPSAYPSAPMFGRLPWNDHEIKVKTCLSEWALSSPVYRPLFDLTTDTELGNLSAMASLITYNVLQHY